MVGAVPRPKRCLGVMTLTRKIQHNLVEDDALGPRNGDPARSNGHVASVGKRERATLPLASRALAGSANSGALLADWLGLVPAFAVADAFLGSTGSRGEMSALAELGVFAGTLPLWTVAAKVYGLYDNDDERTDHSAADDLVGVFHLVTVGTWVLFVGTRLAGFAQPHVWRLVAFWALAIALIALARGLARAYCRRRITYLQNVVIVGAGRVGQLVAETAARPSARRGRVHASSGGRT